MSLTLLVVACALLLVLLVGLKWAIALCLLAALIWYIADGSARYRPRR